VIEVADGSRLPVFSFPETAVRALGHAIRYAAWRSRPQGIVPAVSGVDLDGARTIVRQYLAAHSDGGRLDSSCTAQLMRCAGIPVALAGTGIELVAGMVRDPLLGPVLMVGSGGVFADLLADRRWRGLPLTDLDAAEMVRSLRCAPLLAGYRGAAGADEPAVLDVLHRIAWLAEAVPELSELDINPLIATPAGAFAVDVNLRLAAAAPEPDWYGRRLQGHLTGDSA
jgi:acyl-CoA synthetase (NDP forming)